MLEERLAAKRALQMDKLEKKQSVEYEVGQPGITSWVPRARTHNKGVVYHLDDEILLHIGINLKFLWQHGFFLYQKTKEVKAFKIF